MSIDEKALDAAARYYHEVARGHDFYKSFYGKTLAKDIIEAYEAAKTEQPVGFTPLTSAFFKQFGADPKVHDAVRNPSDPFSVAWHQRESEHRGALAEAKALTREVVAVGFDKWCVSAKDSGHEVQLGSATARQRKLGWDAASASINADISSRIITYRNKLANENPPEDIAYALRFAIEALEGVL